MTTLDGEDGPEVPNNPQAHPAKAALPRQTFSWLTGLAVALIAVLACALRLIHLSSRSLTLDESFSLFWPAPTRLRRLPGLVHSEFNVVCAAGPVRMWLHLGNSEFTARSLSVLCAVATIPVIYLVTGYFGRGAALIACLLLAVHPFHLELSQQARRAPLVLLVSLSSWYFLRMVDDASWARLHTLCRSVRGFDSLTVTSLQGWSSLPTGCRCFYGKSTSLENAGALAGCVDGIADSRWHVPAASAALTCGLDSSRWRQALEVLYSLTLSKGRCLLYLTLWGISLYGVCANIASKLGPIDW